MDDISVTNRAEEVVSKMEKKIHEFVYKTADELLDNLIEAHESQIKMIKEIKDRGEYKTKPVSVTSDLLVAVGYAEDGWPGHNMSVKEVMWNIKYEVKEINSVMGKYDLVKFLLEGK